MIPLVYKGILLKNAMGFNRTFMELKLKDLPATLREKISFNRTFMKLKRAQGAISRAKSYVLIGPSWN